MIVEIEYRGELLTVKGLYIKKEEPIHYPIDKAYAGMPDDFDIQFIHNRYDSDVTNECDENKIIELVLEKINK